MSDEPSQNTFLLEDYFNSLVVLDTKTNYVFIGILTKVDLNHFCLAEADAHDLSSSRTAKDFYLIEAKKYGVNSNRKEILVLKEQVVSISKLENIIEF